MCFVVGNSAFGEKHKQTTGGNNQVASPTKRKFWGLGLCCSCFKIKSIFYDTKTIRVIIFFEILSECMKYIQAKLRKNYEKSADTNVDAKIGNNFKILFE